MKAALQKLRAGAEMDDDERTELLKDLKKARDDLKKGKRKRSDYVLASCEAANLKQLPESGGILDTILSKDSHKDAIKTMFYNPAANGGRGGLTTCVSSDVYKAATDFLHKGGLAAFKDQRTNFYATLLDFNKEWNSKLEMLQPFMVGESYEEHEPMKDKEGNVIMVKGKDGDMHALNTCEAAMHEEECHAKSSSIRGPAGGACLWMPNFSHVDKEMDDWAKKKGVALPSSKGCVRAADFPLPLREATSVDVEAQRKGKQLAPSDKRGMKNGNYVGLNDKSIGDTPVSNKEKGWFSGGFDINTSLGTRRMVPYTMRWDADKKSFVPVDVQKPTTVEDYERSAKLVQALLKRSEKSMPSRVRAKIKRILARNKDITDTAALAIEKEQPNIGIFDLRKRAKAEARKNSKYVDEHDVEMYTLYQMAKHTELTESEVWDLWRHALAGREDMDIMICTNDKTSQEATWKSLASHMNLKQGEAAKLGRTLESWRKDWQVDSEMGEGGQRRPRGMTNVTKRRRFPTYQKKGDGSSLKDFLSGGGGGPMVPVELPPKNSAAAKQMFVTFNHGPLDVFSLEGGDVTLPRSHFLAPRTEGTPLLKVQDFDADVSKAFEGHTEHVAGFNYPNPASCKALIPLPGFAAVLLKANAKHYGPILHRIMKRKAERSHITSETADDLAKPWAKFSAEEFKMSRLLESFFCSKQENWQDAYTHKSFFNTQLAKLSSIEINTTDYAHVAKAVGMDAAVQAAEKAREVATNFDKLAPGLTYKVTKVGATWGASDYAWNPKTKTYYTEAPKAGEEFVWYGVTTDDTTQSIEDNFKNGSPVAAVAQMFVLFYKGARNLVKNVATSASVTTDNSSKPSGWEFEGVAPTVTTVHTILNTLGKLDDNAALLFVQPTLAQRDALLEKKGDEMFSDGKKTYMKERSFGDDGNLTDGPLKEATYLFPTFFVHESLLKALCSERTADNSGNVLLSYIVGKAIAFGQAQQFMAWFQKTLTTRAQRVLACVGGSGDPFEFKPDGGLHKEEELVFTKMPVSHSLCFKSPRNTLQQCMFIAAADAGAITQPAGYATPPKTLKDAQHLMYLQANSTSDWGEYMKDLKKLSVLAVAQMKRGEDPLNRLIMKALPSATQVQELTCSMIGTQIAYKKDATVYRGIVVEDMKDTTYVVQFYGDLPDLSGDVSGNKETGVWRLTAERVEQFRVDKYSRATTSSGLARKSVEGMEDPPADDTPITTAEPAPGSTEPVAPPVVADTAEETPAQKATREMRERNAARRKAMEDEEELLGGGMLTGGECTQQEVDDLLLAVGETEKEFDNTVKKYKTTKAAQATAEAAKAAAEATVVEFTEATNELMKVIGGK